MSTILQVVEGGTFFQAMGIQTGRIIANNGETIQFMSRFTGQDGLITLVEEGHVSADEAQDLHSQLAQEPRISLDLQAVFDKVLDKARGVDIGEFGFKLCDCGLHPFPHGHITNAGQKIHDSACNNLVEVVTTLEGLVKDGLIENPAQAAAIFSLAVKEELHMNSQSMVKVFEAMGEDEKNIYRQRVEEHKRESGASIFRLPGFTIIGGISLGDIFGGEGSSEDGGSWFVTDSEPPEEAPDSTGDDEGDPVGFNENPPPKEEESN